ncbi:acetyl-CoA synthetase-like protein [Penicillium frequentans]|nr:acetyl-CoA synthetase-like protein [Penicillium glabrum]
MDSPNLGFPNDPIFTQLAGLSRTVSDVIIYDDYGIHEGYKGLIGDIIHLRQVLREQLPHHWFDGRGILWSDATPIASIAASGYYFLVGFLAVAAIGGKFVPLPITGPLTTTAWALDKTDIRFCLSEPNVATQAIDIEAHMNATGRRLQIIPIPRVGSISYTTMEIDDSIMISKSDTLLVLFTSGSTGRPKGVALPRERFFFQGQQDPTGLFLGFRPLNYIGSVILPITNVLQGGGIRFLRHSSGVSHIWEAFKESNITSSSITPIALKALQDHYLTTISRLPSEECASYVSGISKLRLVITAGSILNPDTAEFWRKLTNMPIVPAFSTTELGGPTITVPLGTPFTDRLMGEPIRGAEVKVSGGDIGELCIKVHGMFTHYMGDEEATKSAFDNEGFYKTGDIVRQVGNQYFYEGRASCDWIRYSVFTISVIELEQRLNSLPYISEAHVLPVMNYEVRELVAAVVRLKTMGLDQKNALEVNLQKIRQDLSSTTEIYKLPALLRILNSGEETPITASGKPLKNKMRETFFQKSSDPKRTHAVPGVEFWESAVDLSFVLNARNSAK